MSLERVDIYFFRSDFCLHLRRLSLDRFVLSKENQVAENDRRIRHRVDLQKIFWYEKNFLKYSVLAEQFLQSLFRLAHSIKWCTDQSSQFASHLPPTRKGYGMESRSIEVKQRNCHRSRFEGRQKFMDFHACSVFLLREQFVFVVISSNEPLATVEMN